MFDLENRAETLIFMSRHFNKTMTIFLISHFLRFGTLKILTGDYFVLRINKLHIPNKKLDASFILAFFQAFFLQSIFPFTLYRVAYKWRMNRITYQQVNE